MLDLITWVNTFNYFGVELFIIKLILPRLVTKFRQEVGCIIYAMSLIHMK